MRLGLLHYPAPPLPPRGTAEYPYAGDWWIRGDWYASARHCDRESATRQVAGRPALRPERRWHAIRLELNRSHESRRPLVPPTRFAALLRPFRRALGTVCLRPRPAGDGPGALDGPVRGARRIPAGRPLPPPLRPCAPP